VSKENGFLQLRRGVFEHVRDGRMSLVDYAVHSYITAQADTRTGIWNGSAGALAGELSLSRRKARRLIERLSRGGYIKRFPVPGKHVCYPILIHKFSITDGQHKGEQLNAIASSSPVNLEYFASQQEGEQRGQHKGEHVSPQKILETGKEKQEAKPRAAKPAALPDPRFQLVVDFYYQEARRIGLEPTTDDSDFGALKAWLRKNPKRPLENIEASLRNAFNSTDHYPLRRGFRLCEFFKHEMKYQLGPLLKAGPRPVQPVPPRATREFKNELSPTGSRVLEGYGVVR
jgi:hypothetical protein